MMMTPSSVLAQRWASASLMSGRSAGVFASATASSSRSLSTPPTAGVQNKVSASLRTFSSSTRHQSLGTGSSRSLASSEVMPPPLASAVNPLVPTRKERRQLRKDAQKRSKQEKKDNTLAAQMGLKQATVSPYVRIDRQFKTFKPITPSLRWVRFNINSHLHQGGPERSLTVSKRSKGGRNHHGHVTVRGRGGGHRRRVRLVDFWRWEAGTQHVERIEYDPGRSAHIALIKHSETGALSYILAPDGLRSGDVVESYRTADQSTATGTDGATAALDMGIFRTKAIRPGNVLPLHLIPIGTMIHAISLQPNGSAKLVRSAGSSGQLVAFVNRSKASTAKSGEDVSASADADGMETVEVSPGSSSTTHAQVKLQSGEVRLVPVGCCASIGRVSNIDYQHQRIGKAGRSRWLGRRPKVRGVAMNKVDHPHGGGRGKSKSNMHPKSIYGHLTKGKRTRKPHTKNGNQMVVRERPRNLGRRSA
ncbi:unnamed protein product [Parajaminaea phylloscopi]